MAAPDAQTALKMAEQEMDYRVELFNKYDHFYKWLLTQTLTWQYFEMYLLSTLQDGR